MAKNDSLNKIMVSSNIHSEPPSFAKGNRQKFDAAINKKGVKINGFS